MTASLANPSAVANEPRPVSASLIGLALAWVVVFAACFLTAELSNNRTVHRESLLILAPELIAEPFLPRNPAHGNQGSSWGNLSDRFDLLLCAVLVWGGALGWGHLLLRRLPRIENSRSIERHTIAFGLGLAGLSLLTLLLGLAACLTQPVALSLLAAGPLFCLLRRRLPPAGVPVNIAILSPRQRQLLLAATAPFLLIILLGALLPSFDFDVNEYHFQGPKEHFQAGRIRWLPHNVYTSFPFATEMLTLLSMTIRQDWYRGAVAGKCVLAAFGPLTACALFALGRRLFNPLAGAIAAICWLSSPWAYRISTIAYAEGGLCFFVAAALLALVIWKQEATAAAAPDDRRTKLTGAFPVGLFAGAAMSCKYPGLVSSVAPMFLAVLWYGWNRTTPLRAETTLSNPDASATRNSRIVDPLWFLGGVVLMVGPWLIKNLIETGNPVYPLAWTIFGGADWDLDLNSRWGRAHSSSDFSLGSLWSLATEIAVRNDWQSPLFFSLAPLSLLFRRSRSGAAALWLYVVWLFLSCWAFTHRLDRFWVPMLPVVALLAGSGGSELWRTLAPPTNSGGAGLFDFRRLSRIGLTALAVVALLFNLAVSVSPLGGNNGYLQSFQDASQLVARLTAPEIVYLNDNLPAGSRVLSVGDAEMFETRFPVAYNTVFDQSLFEEWMGVADWTGDPAERPLRDPAEIRRKLADEHITHIYVNWLEVLRYRSPGNYGYTPFVAPQRFAELQNLGILGPAWTIPEASLPLEELDAGRLEIVDAWGRQPVVRRGTTEFLATFEVFPVR